MAAVRALREEMVKQLANELPARMVRFHRANVIIDVQLMLPVLTQYVDFQDDVCGLTSSSNLE